ncbi:MAG: hypothetical protein CMP10_19085 [Zetaproteobacteria bacterium]|nr:hypothetical protein [Pseudobdellovibrionaceae bacterium]
MLFKFEHYYHITILSIVLCSCGENQINENTFIKRTYQQSDSETAITQAPEEGVNVPDNISGIYLDAKTEINGDETKLTVSLMNSESNTLQALEPDETVYWSWDSPVEPVSNEVVDKSILILTFDTPITEQELAQIEIKLTFNDGYSSSVSSTVENILSGEIDRTPFSIWNDSKWMNSKVGESCANACSRKGTSFDKAGYTSAFGNPSTDPDRSSFNDRCQQAYFDTGLYSGSFTGVGQKSSSTGSVACGRAGSTSKTAIGPDNDGSSIISEESTHLCACL